MFYVILKIGHSNDKRLEELTLKTWQKIVFVVVLVLFVAASVTISLISISRAPYKYEEQTAIGGDETRNGWVFTGFNGNASTKVLRIDYVRDRDGNDPDETKPVRGIGHYVVNADEYVEELVIGASVEWIDETAFFNAKKLQRVTVDPANTQYQDIDGVLYSKDGKTLLLYPICYGQTPADGKDDFTYPDAYTVPAGVERITSFAFLKNGHLRDLSLPDTLREIGDMTFFGCTALGAYAYDADSDTLLGTGFTLPDGLETIGSDAFSKCGNIAPVLYIPASVQTIRHHAFFACSGMKEILLGAPDEDALSLGEQWRPKNIKHGALWSAPEPQFGMTRQDSEQLIAAYQAERLAAFREEAQNNG